MTDVKTVAMLSHLLLSQDLLKRLSVLTSCNIITYEFTHHGNPNANKTHVPPFLYPLLGVETGLVRSLSGVKLRELFM